MAASPQLLASLKKAHAKMTEATSFPNTEPMREAAIQRFEYTFELSWKLMNSLLADQGMGTAGVKNIIRAAAQLGLISNPTRWFEFAEARNKTSHIYKEEVALEVYRIAMSDFCDYVQRLITAAESEMDKDSHASDVSAGQSPPDTVS